MNEHHLLIFLVQVLLLLGLARGFGELLRRWGLPPDLRSAERLGRCASCAIR